MQADAVDSKACTVCKEVKPLTEFTLIRKDYSNKCKPCMTDYVRWVNIERIHGVNKDEYFEMLKAQNGVCAICYRTNRNSERYLSVDHDHETGKIRGLLCITCNAMLGNAYDTEAILFSGIDYLRQNN